MDLATSEKSRLEENQKKRRNKLKQILQEKDSKVDMYNEQQFYSPKFFEKEEISNSSGKATYIYKRKGNLYWQMRENSEWKGSPLIYEDNCEVFY